MILFGDVTINASRFPSAFGAERSISVVRRIARKLVATENEQFVELGNICAYCGQSRSEGGVDLCYCEKNPVCAECGHSESDHILTAYRRYCTRCGCETSQCYCATPRGLNDDCPMHGKNRLMAQEESPEQQGRV